MEVGASGWQNADLVTPPFNDAEMPGLVWVKNAGQYL